MNNLQSDFSAIRREAARDFPMFRKTYFKRPNRLPDARFHETLTMNLWTMSQKRGSKLALAAPRESGKSTVISLEYVIYCICYSLEPYILLISHTSKQANGLLTDVKAELENNDLLAEDFPEVCETGKRPGPPRWREDEIITKNKIKVTAISSGQQARGRKHRDDRPSLIIVDDLEAGENTQNLESTDKLYEWFTKSILRCGSASTNVIMAGTLHHYDSVLARFVYGDTHPDWIKAIYKSVISWSSRTDLWGAWTRIFHAQEAFEGEMGPQAAKRFFEQNKDAMLAETEVFWPEQKSYYQLMVLREEDYASFDSELQNEPVNPRDCFFNLNEVIYWDDDGRFRTSVDLIRSLGRDCEFFGACDPSLGANSNRGDFSAIVTIARDTKTGTMYVVDADIMRRSPDMTIDTIINHVKIRNYMRFGFESNQFQVLMANELERRASSLGLYMPIEPLVNLKQKELRIKLLQPFVRSGRLQFSKKHITLLDQMRTFPVGAHDDGLDSLAMAVHVCADPQYVEPKLHVIRLGPGWGGISQVAHVGI